MRQEKMSDFKIRDHYHVCKILSTPSYIPLSSQLYTFLVLGTIMNLIS